MFFVELGVFFIPVPSKLEWMSIANMSMSIRLSTTKKNSLKLK